MKVVKVISIVSKKPRGISISDNVISDVDRFIRNFKQKDKWIKYWIFDSLQEVNDFQIPEEYLNLIKNRFEEEFHGLVSQINEKLQQRNNFATLKNDILPIFQKAASLKNLYLAHHGEYLS